jgi:16S rRNA (cytidine1402-2'-O)-methyltransferase
MAKLYIVGTPIGNLADITKRAVDTLSGVDVVACEDTRHSLKLLNNLGIKKPLISCHKHNEKEAAQKICGLISDGKSVALITDAGMPAVSDPGAAVVKECRERGLKIECVPGASALTAAVALCGLEGAGFAFLGFMPQKRGDKVRFLSKYASLDLPLVFYCAPHDIINDAQVLLEVLGDRAVYVAHELTKIHESVIKTTLKNFDIGEPKGEYVLIVEGAKDERDPLLELTLEEHIKRLIDGGMDKKSAVKEAAAKRRIPKNQAYQVALEIKDGN